MQTRDIAIILLIGLLLISSITVAIPPSLDNAKDYTPESVTLLAGTLTLGDVNSVQIMMDDKNYMVNEIAGTPAFNIEFNFTNIDKNINYVVTRWLYEGSSTHYVTIDIYNYVTDSWNELRTFSDNGGYYSSMTQYIPLNINNNYVSNGNAKVRFYHVTSGVLAHDIHIDYVGLHHEKQ